MRIISETFTDTQGIGNKRIQCENGVNNQTLQF